MIEYVRLWESELLAGRNLPSICVVTGEDAVTWETCCYEFQRGEGGAPDIRLTGELPVSARVRHQSLLTDWIVGVTGLGGLATVVAGFVAGAGFGHLWGLWLLLGGLGGSLLVPPAASVLARAASRLPKTPTAIVCVDRTRQRGVLVGPVHPNFAAAITRLPRPRP